MKELKHGFIDVEKTESMIRKEIQKEMLRHTEIKRITEELKTLSQKLKNGNL